MRYASSSVRAAHRTTSAQLTCAASASARTARSAIAGKPTNSSTRPRARGRWVRSAASRSRSSHMTLLRGGTPPMGGKRGARWGDRMPAAPPASGSEREAARQTRKSQIRQTGPPDGGDQRLVGGNLDVAVRGGIRGRLSEVVADILRYRRGGESRVSERGGDNDVGVAVGDAETPALTVEILRPVRRCWVLVTSTEVGEDEACLGLVDDGLAGDECGLAAGAAASGCLLRCRRRRPAPRRWRGRRGRRRRRR